MKTMKIIILTTAFGHWVAAFELAAELGHSRSASINRGPMPIASAEVGK